MRDSYKRSNRELEEDYELDREYRRSPRFRKGDDRYDAITRDGYVKHDENGYHLHLELSLTKQFLEKITSFATKLFGSVVSIIDDEDTDYRDRRDYRSDRRSRDRYRDRDYSTGYDERPRRR